MIEVTATEAQNHFGKLLDTVQREPVVITRRGRVAAYLLSPGDMDALKGVRGTRNRAVAEFEARFAKSDPNLADAGNELTEEHVVRMVHEEL